MATLRWRATYVNVGILSMWELFFWGGWINWNNVTNVYIFAKGRSINAEKNENVELTHTQVFCGRLCVLHDLYNQKQTVHVLMLNRYHSLYANKELLLFIFLFFNHSKSDKHFLTDQNLCSIYSQSWQLLARYQWIVMIWWKSGRDRKQVGWPNFRITISNNLWP